MPAYGFLDIVKHLVVSTTKAKGVPALQLPSLRAILASIFEPQQPASFAPDRPCDRASIVRRAAVNEELGYSLIGAVRLEISPLTHLQKDLLGNVLNIVLLVKAICAKRLSSDRHELLAKSIDRRAAGQRGPNGLVLAKQKLKDQKAMTFHGCLQGTGPLLFLSGLPS